ncbi:hypothetical protein [Weissella minor]|nr:hypothetical protein [Weissella minor]
MSKLMKWVLGIVVAVGVVFGGVAMVGSNTDHKETKTSSSVSSKKSSSESKSSSEQKSSSESQSSSTSNSETETNASEQSRSEEASAPAEASSQTQAAQPQQNQNQGAAQAAPNASITTPDAAKNAVATHMRQVQTFDPNRFNLEASAADDGQSYYVNVSSSQIDGVLAVYQVQANGAVTQIQ